MSEEFAPNSPTPPPQLSLRDLVAVLFRRKALIAGVFLSVFSAVALVTFLMPKEYESHMKILVKNERADLVVSPDARNGAILRSDVSEAQVNSEIELLTSTDLLARVVRTCRLYEHASGTVHASGDPLPEPVERAVRRLQRDLKITPVRKANVIQIAYAASTPDLAAGVLKQLSGAYLDAHLSVHRTAGTQEFFRAQTARYEAALHAAEDSLSEFRRRHSLTSIVEQKDLTLRKQLDAEGELREASAGAAEAASRIRELRRQIAAQPARIVTQSRVVPNQYSVERLNSMLAELQNRRTQALMKFRPDDRMVTEIEEEIANTRAALDRAAKMTAVEESTDVNPLRHALEADLARAEGQAAGLLARQDSLAAAVSAYRTRLAQLETGTIEHDALQRAAKEAEDNYLLYTRKQEEARIADSLDQQKIANVAIAEAPVEQHLPAKPNVLLNLALGLFLAGFVGLGAGFGAEFAGGGFHTPAALEAATGLPVLATVPDEKA